MYKVKYCVLKKGLFILLVVMSLFSFISFNETRLDAKSKNDTKKVYDIKRQVDLKQYSKIRSGKELLSRKNPLSTKGLSNQEIQNLGETLWAENKQIDPDLKVTLRNDAGEDINIKFENSTTKSSRTVTRSLIRQSYQVINRQSGAIISGSVIAKINVDGTIAYCVQPGVMILEGDGYSSLTELPYIGANEQELVNKYLNFANGDTDTGYMAAQALIWHTLGWDVSYSIDVSADIQELVNKVNNFDTLPSINNQTIEIKEGKTGGEIIDTNGVLSSYDIIENTSSATVEKNNNSLKATVPVGADDGGSITLSRGGTAKGSLLFWVKPNSQTIATAGALSPKVIKLNVKVKRLAPSIKTMATDKETNSKDASPEQKITLVDKVSYTDLIPGKEYVLEGKLMDKATGKVIVVDKKELTSRIKFTPTTENGTVNLEFTFNASTLAGKEVVVFEYLYLDNIEVTTHTDINDLGQTVKFKNPEIGTTATEKNSGTKEFDADDSITVIDEVSYKDLIVGKTYTMKGVLMDKSTNKPLVVNNKKVESKKEFVASSINGIVEMEFTFDAYALTGKELVVFEDLYRNGSIVVSHANINDLQQTVKVKTPEIKTSASDKETGSSNLEENSNVVIVDKVMYKGLIVGKTYTVKGVLMDKTTNKPLLVNGKKITSSKTFAPVKTDGYIELEFKLNTKDLQGREIVVFENLYRRDALVVSHSNINDKDQTVRITGSLPITGSNMNAIVVMFTIAMTLGAYQLAHGRKFINK